MIEKVISLKEYKHQKFLEIYERLFKDKKSHLKLIVDNTKNKDKK